jgi:transcription initiation factor TFIID TATA-box-binding protein
MKAALIESEKSPGRPCNVRIENVVATASLDQEIDLLAIMKVFRNVEYRLKKFPGLVFALERPITKTLIFTTGKMVCTGAKSVKMAGSAVRKVVRELKKNGIIIFSKPVITVQNMVASAYVGGKVDLEDAAYVLDNIMYEPEQFPGAIYRIKDPKAVILIFSTGKLVITGAKSEEQAQEAAENVRAVLADNDLLF